MTTFIGSRISVWAACRAIKKTDKRLLTTVPIVLAIGAALLWGYSKLAPSRTQPEAPRLSATDPLVRLEPEYLQYSPPGKSGEFALQFANSGIDVNYIGVQQDYFSAENDHGVVKINRILKVDPHPQSDIPPLRANRSLPIALSFTGFVKQIYDGLRKSGREGILSVRLIITFHRYSDQAPFRMVKAFEARGSHLEMLSPPGDLKSPQGGPFVFEQVMPYIDSDDHWADPIFRINPDGRVSLGEGPPPPF